MRFVQWWALALAFPIAAMPLSAQQFSRFDTQGLGWYKGNTHTHTSASDGDSPPEQVARWYKEHGYQFLVLSDHNVFTDPAALAQLADSTYLLIPGEELTTSLAKKPVHVNALNIPHAIKEQQDTTLLGTIQRNVDAVRAVSGVPHINHPNFGWALDTAVLARVERDRLLEIFNGHPTVHNRGGDDSPGLEAVWDWLLSHDRRLYGIAVDDAHHFQGEFAPDRANPGRGWIVVAASGLNAAALMEALEAGQFYASTGVVLERLQAEPGQLTVTIRPRSNFKYTTEFIGQDGAVLARVGGVQAAYALRGGERYVRARGTDSGGAMAWVQPVFVTR
ncbi:MAG: PHP domain-containing protein [Gemmatimonadetes bacterium]|nr:PHP domain-containing protein [Gemmatimonadota bacterium]